MTATTLETDFLSITVNYSTGGVIQSIVDRVHDREWLSSGIAHSREEVGDDFSTSGFFGWDEMLPTIVGDGLPDHGDIWCRSWEIIQQAGSSSTGQVRSPSTALTLTRSIELHDDSPSFSLRYRVTGASTEPTAFLWAAHPLFVADEHTRVTSVPEGVWRRTDPLPDKLDVLPQYPLSGRDHGWAGKWWSELGERFRQVTMEAADTRTISIEWDERGPITSVGIWADNGRFSANPTIAIEPAIGWLDDLHRAVGNRTAGYASSESPLAWELVVRCG